LILSFVKETKLPSFDKEAKFFLLLIKKQNPPFLLLKEEVEERSSRPSAFEA